MKRLRDWLDGTINEYLWIILVAGSLLAIILLHKKPQDPRSMRYYPDDIIKVVTIDPQQESYCVVQGVPQPGAISEETIVAGKRAKRFREDQVIAAQETNVKQDAA